MKPINALSGAIALACIFAAPASAHDADAASPAAMYAATAQSQPAVLAGPARAHRTARLHSHRIVVRPRLHGRVPRGDMLRGVGPIAVQWIAPTNMSTSGRYDAAVSEG